MHLKVGKSNGREYLSIVHGYRDRDGNREKLDIDLSRKYLRLGDIGKILGDTKKS